MTINLSGIVILAGGESSRMGSPKALLPLPTGETLLDYHICHAKNLNVPVMVADNGKHFCQNKSVKIIDDYIKNDETGKGAGALSAIASAIENLTSQNGYLMVISCDCLIGADLVFAKLVHQIIDEDVVYLKSEKDYPLLGLYRVDLLPTLKDFLDNGSRSVMKFLSDRKVKAVALPNELVALANFNTLDEFQKAKNKL